MHPPKDGLIELPTMQEEKNNIRCLRCNGLSLKEKVKLPNGSYFCPYCMELGTVKSSHKFYHKKAQLHAPLWNTLTWHGSLTKGQQMISDSVVEAIKKTEKLLVHAVTGAGKTEMIFEGIQVALEKGLTVGIAIPRVDVCIELYPRMKEAFSTIEIGLLHGRSKEEFRDLPLIICTTHQLMRFYDYFDVLIVDEVDAFPFAYNEQLAFALKNACKKTHSLIYLTATPSQDLLKEMPLVTLPARFHRKLLTVPEFIWCGNWREKLLKKKLAKSFRKVIRNCIEDDFPFLIFCPVIDLLPLLKEAITQKFGTLTFETVS
ncbi:MAG: DEAD/DEAH box helicase family protein, partial [Streptococcaceae bacterium]|nr:DEAD/DEAH box helicase family protein [Streptococcaceae bacterium]